MIEKIRQILLSNTGISRVVGRSVFCGLATPSVQMPYIVITLISQTTSVYIDGISQLYTSRVQVDCYGTTYKAAAGLYGLVRTALNGYSDDDFQGIFLSSARDLNEYAAIPVFRVSCDFQTNHKLMET